MQRSVGCSRGQGRGPAGAAAQSAAPKHPASPLVLPAAASGLQHCISHILASEVPLRLSTRQVNRLGCQGATRLGLCSRARAIQELWTCTAPAACCCGCCL